MSDLINAMKQGTADCVADGKDFHLSYLVETDGMKFPDRVAGISEEDDEDISQYHFGIEKLEDYFEDYDDSIGKEMINTPMGTIDRRRAESYYLNGGRSTIGYKARPSRFYYNEYDSSKVEHGTPAKMFASARTVKAKFSYKRVIL